MAIEIDRTPEEDKIDIENDNISYAAKDISRIIFLLNNFSFKGIEQASGVVEILNILNNGKVIKVK